MVWEERCCWAWLGQEGIQEWTLSWDHKSDSYGPGFLPCFPPRPLGLFGASTSICPRTSWAVGNSWRWLFPCHRWRNWSTKRQSSLNRCSHSVTWSVGFVPCRLYPKPDNKQTLIHIQQCPSYRIPSCLSFLVFRTVTVTWAQQRVRHPYFLNSDTEAQRG